MPVGENATIITQDLIHRLAQKEAWRERHRHWPEFLLRIGMSPGEEPETNQREVSFFLRELFDSIMPGDEPKKEDSIFYSKHVADEVFAGNGAALGLHVFATVPPQSRGSVERPVEHRVALARDAAGRVYQLWNGAKSRHPSSVLGRVGSISIICERIEQELRSKLIAGAPQPRVTTGELARFIYSNKGLDIIPTTKLLDRVNQGCFVSGGNLAKILKSLHISVDDIAFVHYAIFAGTRARRGAAYTELRRKFPPQHPTKLLSGAEKELSLRIENERGPLKLEVRTTDNPVSIQLKRKLEFIIETCPQQTSEQAEARFREISQELANAELAAWISYIGHSREHPDDARSYIARSANGDPDGHARLIVRIDDRGKKHEFMEL